MLISNIREVPESLVCWDCLDEYAHFVANGFGISAIFGTVLRNMLISDFGEVPKCLLFCFWTVSTNTLMSDCGEVPESFFLVLFWDCLRLIAWPMGFGVFVFLGLSRRMCSCDGLWLLVMRIHTHAKFHAQLHMNVHVHIHDETNNTTPDIRTKQKDPNERKQGRACSCARPWFVPAARAEGVDSAGGGGYHVYIYIYTCIHTCKHTYLLTYVFT